MRVRPLAAVAIATGVLGLGSGAAQAAPQRHIVLLEKGSALSPAEAAQHARGRGGEVHHVYRHALRGYAATLPESAVERIRRAPGIAEVAPDSRLKLFATQFNPPNYGLDRVDQRALPLNQAFTYDATGTAVDAYVIDTGIRRSHQDFGGRAVTGTDLIDGGEVEDCQGHGTHVSGTVGGTAYGVAKGVRLLGVRIGACGTSINTSTAVAGIDWVTGHHQPGKPAVANMSFGGGTNTTMDQAVKNMIADGVTAVIAAGNGNLLGLAQDACTTSPARVPEAITVSSVNQTDNKVGYANYGTCVDIFAPGLDIVSASHSSDTGSATMGGTSMAAPHVAGAAAMYLQTNPSATPAQVAQALTANATQNAVKSPGSGSPNRLLYTAFIGGGGSTNAAPTASYTSSCSGLACTFTDTSTDSDGSIASRAWDFGDGTGSTAAAPSKTYGAAGTYAVKLTVTDDKGASATTTQNVTVSSTSDPDPSTPTLTSGVATSSTSAAAGGWKYFKIAVPAGKSRLSVVLDGPACGLIGCNPDLDVFVRQASKPTTSAFNCSGETGSSDESCSVTNPAAAYWYVGVYTYSGSSGASFTIRATVS